MITNGIEILDTVWFDEFGFIKGKDTCTGEIKIYAGIGEGIDEKTDIENIVTWGKKYLPDDFIAICKQFGLVK